MNIDTQRGLVRPTENSHGIASKTFDVSNFGEFKIIYSVKIIPTVRHIIKNSNEVNIIKNNLQNIIDLIDLDINNLATYHFKRSMVTFCTTYTPLDINTVKILSQLFLYQHLHIHTHSQAL